MIDLQFTNLYYPSSLPVFSVSKSEEAEMSQSVKIGNFSSSLHPSPLKGKSISDIGKGQSNQKIVLSEGEIEQAMGLFENMGKEPSGKIDSSGKLEADLVKRARLVEGELTDKEKEKLAEGLKFLHALLPFEVIASHEKLVSLDSKKTLKSRIRSLFSALGIHNFSKELKYKNEMEGILSLEALFLKTMLDYNGADVHEVMLPFQLLLIKKIDKLQQRLYSTLAQIKSTGDPLIFDQQVKEIQERLEKWQIELNKMKSQLDIDLVKYGISAVSTGLDMVKFPLDHQIFSLIPSQVALQVFSLSLESMGMVMVMFRIAALSYEIFRRRGQSKELFGWTRDYEIREKTKSVQSTLIESSDTDKKINVKVTGLLKTKFSLEKKVSNFRFNSACLYLATAGCAITLSTILVTISALVLPIPALGVLLGFIGAGSLAVSVILITASLHLSYKYLPESTISSIKLVTLRCFGAEIRSAISAYKYKKNIEKQQALAELINAMDVVKTPLKGKERKEYRRLLESHLNAKEKAEKSAEKVIYWNGRIEYLKKKHEKSLWKDLVNQLDNPPKDPKEALKELAQALVDCDLEKLSADTKYLLEVQMGLDVKDLQKEKEKLEGDPAKAVEWMSDKIRSFFSLTDYQLVNFIKSQRALIEKGLLNPSAY